jgi:hypothetical protein
MRPSSVLWLFPRGWKKLLITTPTPVVRKASGLSDKDWAKLRVRIHSEQSCNEADIALYQNIALEIHKQHTYHDDMSFGPEGEVEAIKRLKASIREAGLPAVEEELGSWLFRRIYQDNMHKTFSMCA